MFLQSVNKGSISKLALLFVMRSTTLNASSSMTRLLSPISFAITNPSLKAQSSALQLSVLPIGLAYLFSQTPSWFLIPPPPLALPVLPITTIRIEFFPPIRWFGPANGNDRLKFLYLAIDTQQELLSNFFDTPPVTRVIHPSRSESDFVPVESDMPNPHNKQNFPRQPHYIRSDLFLAVGFKPLPKG